MYNTVKEFEYKLKEEIKEQMKKTMESNTVQNYLDLKLLLKTYHYLCESKHSLLSHETSDEAIAVAIHNPR